MTHPESHLTTPDLSYHPDRWPGCGDCIRAAVPDIPTVERRRQLRADATLARLEAAYSMPTHARARDRRKTA